jgi:hypothetical protein
VGTFHQGKHELHGITVLIETDGGDLWVGRCDDIVGGEVRLRDADVLAGGGEESARTSWLDRAQRHGVWPRHRRVALAEARVVSLRPLGQA